MQKQKKHLKETYDKVKEGETSQSSVVNNAWISRTMRVQVEKAQ